MEAHSILTLLERRLEKTEYSGFSIETLSKRKEILVESSKVLLEEDKRRDYENMITKTHLDSKENELEVRAGCHIAGLLLMLEAGHAEECLSMAYFEYQEWKSRVGEYGSCHQDLLLVIDYATLEYAKSLKENRFYEGSASVIEKRLSTIEKDVGSRELRNKMENELEKLIPYRVLDLISRESGGTSHKYGIEMLKYLVRESGGLDNESNKYMKNKEFKAFFRQIRLFLTVQEQIDLFRDWAYSGSKAAAFLAAIALVASGFVQRKAEKMVEALQVVKRIESDEIQPMVANIYLLLGDVRKAEELFELYADKELKEWSESYSDEVLGKLCGWCREWLSRDVLNGYRDIEADANLEAYFGDRDVIAFLESIDVVKTNGNNDLEGSYKKEWLRSSMNERVERMSMQGEKAGTKKEKMRLVSLTPRLQGLGREKKIVIGLIATTILGSFVFLSSKQIGVKEARIRTTVHQGKEMKGTEKAKSKNISDIGSIYSILSRYHAIKGDVLAGRSLPIDAKYYLSDNAIERVMYEREKNREEGETQVIDVKIRKVTVERKTESSLVLKTILDYKDKTLNEKGDVVSETPGHSFERMYTLINKGNRWLVN